MGESVDFLSPLSLCPSSTFGPDSFIFIKESGESDGSFILHALLAEFNKKTIFPSSPQTLTILVLSQNASHHWATVGTKLGINFNTLKDSRQLIVVDILKEYQEWLSGNNKGSCLLNEETGVLQLPQLLKKLTEVIISSQDNYDNIFIIIEDLYSIQLTSKSNIAQIYSFINDLRFKTSKTISNSSLDSSTTFSTDSEKNAKVSLVILSNDLEHEVFSLLCTTYFEVSPLTTGWSQEINGVLSIKEIQRKYTMNFEGNKKKVRKFHYKLLDKNFKFTSI